MVSNETVTTVEIDAPVGPDEAEETSFLAEQRRTNPPAQAAMAAHEDEASPVPLPPMDELIQRIPVATRELIDQLFRAKFITVKRLPTSAFKTQK